MQLFLTLQSIDRIQPFMAWTIDWLEEWISNFISGQGLTGWLEIINWIEDHGWLTGIRSRSEESHHLRRLQCSDHKDWVRGIGRDRSVQWEFAPSAWSGTSIGWSDLASSHGCSQSHELSSRTSDCILASLCLQHWLAVASMCSRSECADLQFLPLLPTVHSDAETIQ